MTLTPEQEQNFLQRGSRGGALAGSQPWWAPERRRCRFTNEAALAQGLSRVEAPPDAVLINANENP